VAFLWSCWVAIITGTFTICCICCICCVGIVSRILALLLLARMVYGLDSKALKLLSADAARC
jgi:hypothetical protein